MKWDKARLKEWFSRTKPKRSTISESWVVSFFRKLNLNPVRSIGARLFLSFFLVIVISVSGVGFLSFTKSRDIIHNEASEAQRNTIVQAGEKLKLIMDSYQAKALQLSMLSEIQLVTVGHRLSSDDRSSLTLREREIESRLNEALYTDNHIEAIHLIPMQQGLPVLVTAGVNRPDYSNAKWLEQTRQAQSGFWLPSMPNGPSGMMRAPGLGYVALVKDVNAQRLDYVLLMEIRETVVQDMIGHALGEDGIVMLVDADGTILSSPNRDEMFTPLPVNLSASEGAATQIFEINGVQMLTTYYDTGVNGWKIVGMQPFDNLVRETTEIFDFTIWMMVAGTFMAVIIGLFAMRYIGYPLSVLSELMKKAEGGDLSVRSKNTKRRDEIGMLSQSFNAMMTNIRALVEESNQSAQSVMETANQLSEASRQTAQSAKEIALATEQIAQGASNVAMEAEKVGEMTTTVGGKMKETIRANEEMVQAAMEIRKQNEQGTKYMQALSEKTAETERLTSTMVERVEVLKESTGSIRQILNVLAEMTRQTNILALNATIEAARAGDAGRGFMVVAGEIRKLADQSKENILSVGAITDKIQKEIEETVQVMTKAYPLFQEQIESVKETNEIFVAVNEHMESFIEKLDQAAASVRALEQSQAALAAAMDSVSAVAEETSATTEEVAGLSSEQEKVGESLVGLAARLEDVSARLRDNLNKFRL